MRVIKLGGSLLDLPDLGVRLTRFLHELTPQDSSLILVGGGPIVDAVRQYDRLWKLDESDCHWLCVQLMNSTARLVQLLSPKWPLISDPPSLTAWASFARRSKNPTQCHPIAIVAPDSFYSPNINASALPLSWETTSDSIAALLASVVNAEQLILLKSADPPQELAGFLDSEELRLERTESHDLRIRNMTNDGHSAAVARRFVDSEFFNSLPPNLNVLSVNLRDWQPMRSE